MKSNAFWLILFSALIIISAVTALLLRQVPMSRASIYLNGILTETVNLTIVEEHYTVTIDTDGRTNVIEVERGRIRMMEASCPDKTCVRQGWASNGLTPIVCLPNRLVITLESSNDSDIDAAVG